jgi:(1->4)-alpha-D-glucan 1-alpha-D-glucosylmutase
MTPDDLVAEILRAPSPRPSSTYRLQLGADLDFRAAAARLPYLARLGVSHVYLAPILEAAPGSRHGYDVVDHTVVRAELGGEDGFAALAAAAAAHGVGIIVDFVPNHMGVGAANAMWMDVLENGPSSVYAPFFDIDWRPVKDELENKVLVPILGDQFGLVLERGELQLVRDGGAFHFVYFAHRFPCAPRSVPRLLSFRLDELRAHLGDEDHGLMELLSIITALEKLPPRHIVEPEVVSERAREKEVAKRRLAALFDASAAIREHVDENVRIYNGTPGDPRSFDLLAELLDAQAYRLAHWRVAGEEINYRRFFDVNDLAAIRMEDERVFAHAHRLLLRLLVEGKIHGVRIDHPDGLYAPAAYLQKLQDASVVERCVARAGDGEREAVVAAVARARADGRIGLPLYVVVEKILERGERMPATWCADGTTGYELLAALNGVFVERRSARAFTGLYQRFTSSAEGFPELVYEAKKLIMTSSMASEINMLSRRLNRISENDRRTRDFTLNALTEALTEYIACLPVYRTYIDGHEIDPGDVATVEATVAHAARRARKLNPSIFDFLRDILLLRHPPRLSDDQKREHLELVRILQQVTPPVTAKAVEDTAFYRYNRLVSLNEIGGDPEIFGTEPAELHALAAERLDTWPGSLNATSTHDTKRSEDVRLRIDALSEIPGEWSGQIRRWARLARPWKRLVDDRLAPDRNDELLLYQTLVGVFPDEGVTPELVARVQAYMDKALKEAKLHTTWTNPNARYDEAMRSFVAAVLGSPAFLAELAPLAGRVARAAAITSLAQTALKLALPGVADVYQGCDMTDLSLVDPDNRRPVDWARREQVLDEIARAGDRAALAREWSRGAGLTDGRAKLLLLQAGMALRRRAPELLARGAYLPLQVEGLHGRHAIALARMPGVICVVPRLVLELGTEVSWDGGVELPRDLARPLRCVVTGASVTPRDGVLALADCFAGFPVALLEAA